MYREGNYLGFPYRVNENGDCYTLNGKLEWTHREWHYNQDGYAVVSATGRDKRGQKAYRSLAVHILVAREFVDGWFEGAEVNHKDFNRANPAYWNLEWLSHIDNIKYSYEAGKYRGKSGADNPNYGNDTLHKKYKSNPALAKEKQSRPRGQNGRALKCNLINNKTKEIFIFDCQRDAVDFLISIGVVDEMFNKEYIIHQLKRSIGYQNWRLTSIK